VFFATIATAAINFYGFICGVCIMTGRRVRYSLTLKAPIVFVWLLYASVLGAWTILNIVLLKNLSFGYWIYVGAAGLSLLMRYHYKYYLSMLKKIRTFMFLMGDE